MAQKKYQKSLFIFRRDFRTTDNTGLNLLIAQSKAIIPVFIFTPEQIDSENPYRSDNAIQFMIEGLSSLDTTIGSGGLRYFRGDNIKVLTDIIKHDPEIDCVGFNRDWTPYAVHRDTEIIEFCEKKGIDTLLGEDYTLWPMGTLVKEDETPYKVYGPFRRKAMSSFHTIKKPAKKTEKIPWFQGDLKSSFKTTLSSVKYKKNSDILVHASRKLALEKISSQALKKVIDYSDKRDLLTYNTTHLSAYLKFGLVSIREVFKSFAKNKVPEGLFDQLLWKEFYVYIGHYLPHVLTIRKPMNMKPDYEGIKWKNSPEIFKKWCSGMTGFPIVDAGMREMNTTGYMHNRSRLITSGFLVKLAIIDWRMGEKYFATSLVDYDPAQNNGGWQWSSGSGADSQPYFRILSPISQAKRFDPEAAYIKKWCPELKDVPAGHLHDWEAHHKKYTKIGYPEPCLDYKKARVEVMQIYKSGLGK